MTPLQQKLLNAFDSEQKTIFTCIRSHLVSVEQGAAWKPTGLEECLRMAHTLKGAARVVDLSIIVDLSHRFETLFSVARSQKIALDAEKAKKALRILDVIEDLISTLRKNPTLTDEVKKTGQNALADIDQLMGASAPTPSPQEISPPSKAEEPKENEPAIESFRLKAEYLDSLLSTAGELLVYTGNSADLAEQISEIESLLRNFQADFSSLKKSVKMSDRSVVNAVDQLERGYHSLSRKTRTVQQVFQQRNLVQKRLGEQLRAEIQKARLVPAEVIFEGFSKMVRDLALQEKKKVEIRTYGLDLEVDRLVLLSLRSPLMHMLRNSVSHGLELPEVRTRAGKDPVGRITFKVSVSGRFLKIVLEDDGRGLDYEAIRKSAQESKVDSKENIEKASPENLAELIFKPGFSTSSQITEVSGRGMGLSVVKETVRRLNGTIKLDTSPGAGLRFTLSLPMKATVDRMIIAACNNQTIAIPLSGIECIKKSKISDLIQSENHSSLLYSGVPLRVCALSSLLEHSDAPVNLKDSLLTILVFKSGTSRLAAAVDKVLGEHEFAIKRLSQLSQEQSPWTGVVVLPDGSAAPVLDSEFLFSEREIQHPLKISEVSATPEKKSNGVKSNRILVVDDSITTRTLEKGILEANGFQVELAVDGQEALRKLQTQRFDLVISDVEMPVMDGFGLLTEVKMNSHLSSLPFILVTSRESDHDRQRGITLGADHYFFKQKFDQAALLEAIRTLL